MSLTVLKRIKDNPSRLSILLNNGNFMQEMGDEDNFMLEILKLRSKRFIQMQKEYDEEEGDDYSLKITEMGKSFLSYKDK